MGEQMEKIKIFTQSPLCGSTTLEGPGDDTGYIIKCVDCGVILEDDSEEVEDNIPFSFPDIDNMFDDMDNLDEVEDDGECEECKL